MSRPSLYSDALAAELCERLASGESLNAICKDPHMPTRQAVHEWIADNRAGFGDKYARAREVQADHFADEIISIVDTEPDANRARVRMDGRKWVSSKLAPKKYGDKVQVGGDVNNPLKVYHQVAYVIVDPKDPGSAE